MNLMKVSNHVSQNLGLSRIKKLIVAGQLRAKKKKTLASHYEWVYNKNAYYFHKSISKEISVFYKCLSFFVH